MSGWQEATQHIEAKFSAAPLRGLVLFRCQPRVPPLTRLHPGLLASTRSAGSRCPWACAHAETNCIARLEAGIEICLRQSKLPLRSIEIRLRRSKLHPAKLGATKINNNLSHCKIFGTHVPVMAKENELVKIKKSAITESVSYGQQGKSLCI